ncbi:MAG: tRNA (guanosine(46)-N7)-methyltransferase TrmB [Bacteroidetes bacterium RIFCSPLOWO2_12_FULL_35_15]|nr:MAG: tRNA (guanosine(46)-N7)-methyltransferase TrmB [Bacteroidetes bacterium RIFCSPLOWO2_12_FULL_35_15]
MAKNKQKKFREVDSFDNCFFLSFEESRENGLTLKGKWHTQFFRNNNPIVLELGCGKGEYTIGLAKRFPDKNFIGIDIKGNRIWTGAKIAVDEKMNNVAFLRTRIDFIEACFAANEVSEIWITFPDPQPQKTRVRKRLTNMMFINRYKNLMVKGGIINLKTDSEPFYDFSREVIQENKLIEVDATNDLYADPTIRDEALTNIKTYYEKLFSEKGFKICYLKYKIE